MATEALRRLREDIDAAFEAQQRPSNDIRCGQVSFESLTAKWAQVTALLASVGRPDAAKPASGTAKRVSATFGPVGGFCASDKLQQMTESEKQTLLRKFMLQWRQTAHAAAVVTRLHVRVRRRRELQLAREVFRAWRRRCSYKLLVREAANCVKRGRRLKGLVTVWGRWSCARRRVATLRAFGLKRRRRLSCEAFCTWVLVANQRTRYRSYKQKATRQLLRRYWRWFGAGMEAQRMISGKIECFTEHRTTRLLVRCVATWVDFVEQRKQWQFAVRWNDHRVLGNTYDCWREVHDHTRQVRHGLQLAARRRRRSLLREVLSVWINQTHLAKTRKRVLVVVLHSQQRRSAFMHLMCHARYDRERECSLQYWKTRRAVRMWLRRSHQHRMLRLRVAFLTENHERLVLRAAVWHPWRRAYLRSVNLRKMVSNRRLNLLRKTWLAFVDAINQQEQQRLAVESIVDTREARKLRQLVAVWRVRVQSIRASKKLTARSAAFYRRGLLQRMMLSWRAAHQIVRREKFLDAMATMRLASKMVQHWAKWARWNKLELAERIAAVLKRRRQRQMQQYICHWWRVVLARNEAICAQVFCRWRKAIDLQLREQRLVELQQLVKLRHRWQRWGSFVLRCQEIHAIARKTKKLREDRLVRYSFVDVWLHKSRSYRLGSNLLSAFSERRLLSRAVLQWRENQQQRRAVRCADAFRTSSLSRRSLRLLFTVTIGYRCKAVAYARRGCLLRVWNSWEQYHKLRRRRREADVYFQDRAIQKAVRLLHVAAQNAIECRNQRLDAEAWYEAVMMQKILSQWFEAAKHSRRCRSLRYRLSWKVVGRRAYRLWQNALIERQQLFKAAQFHSSMLVRRTWKALLRMTRRRQVALAMWSHAMAHIRLSYVVLNWKTFVNGRRGQYAVAASMHRMQERRSQQRLFTAWAILPMAHTMASRREQRELLKWRQRCWSHWKLWRASSRRQRSQQQRLLQYTFCQGLKRHAIQQQACREICLRSARGLLHRSLARWRVELCLVRNQQKLTTETKRKALSHWKRYTAACRQKRQWEHYVQQLHRSQTRSKAVMVGSTPRTGGTFRDTRALQAQLKRHRVWMTHVLHAWYLVAQSRRRRMQSRLLALSSSKRSRRKAAELPRSNLKARQAALEFWARGMMQKYFFAWRERSGHRAELA